MWPSAIPSALTNPNKLPWSVRCRGFQVDMGGSEIGPLRAIEQTIIADFAEAFQAFADRAPKVER